MNDCVRVSSCRLCDSPDLDLIIAFTPTPLGDQYLKEPRKQQTYPLDLMSCRSCGAVQLAHTVDPKSIYTDYIYTTSISPGLDAHFDQYAASVLERLKPRKGAFVLDIGSNDGTLLKAFDRRGCFVAGVDPARSIADAATAADIPTYCGYFGRAFAQQILDDQGQADIITANHIMANVADLHDFIEGVRLLLAPDGWFVFETGSWPSIMQKRLIDTIEHEHIHYFDTPPMEAFFRRHELSLEHAEVQPTKGGSIRGFVHHAALATWPQWASAGHGPDGWADGLRHLRSEIGLFIDFKPKTEHWVGYGAAVGSTLLLHHFGLGSVLSELWDDNISRHGMYSPGFHLPVVPPNASRPDKIVILAWRYADRIMAAHPEHAGKWIIPLPELRFA